MLGKRAAHDVAIADKDDTTMRVFLKQRFQTLLGTHTAVFE